MTAADRGWGPGWPHCTRDNLVTLQAGRLGLRLPVHHLVAPLFSRLIDELETARGMPFRPDWSWGFACRAISGTSTPSNHSWGLSIDLDAPDNPYMSRAAHGRHRGARLYPGGFLVVSTMPLQVQAICAKFGMRWGGTYYTKPDPMHIEFMGTPDDAREIERRTRPGAAPVPVPPPPPAPPVPAPLPPEVDMWWLIKGEQRPEWWLYDGTSKTHIPNRDIVGYLAMIMKDKLDARRQGQGSAAQILPHVVDQAFVDWVPLSVHQYTAALDMRVRFLQETAEAAHPFSRVAMHPETAEVVEGVDTKDEATERGLLWVDPMVPRLLRLTYDATPGQGNGG